MKIAIALLVTAGILAGCASHSTDSLNVRASEKSDRVERSGLREAVSNAGTLDGYKREAAQRIAHVNAAKVYVGQPQALLRSVVVLRYAVDARGQLMRSEILRSNHDRETEATALASLHSAAPFAKPASHLLRHGKMEISETWLFNNDGRFQLRTIAEPQMDH